MDSEKNEVSTDGNIETGSDQCRRVSELVRQESYSHSENDGCSPREHGVELRFERNVTIDCDDSGNEIGKLYIYQ